VVRVLHPQGFATCGGSDSARTDIDTDTDTDTDTACGSLNGCACASTHECAFQRADRTFYRAGAASLCD